jgi:hypothetical protein
MPDKVECDGVEMHFEGLDESGWVWINGEYAGNHDIGPSGWDVPFSLDITDIVKWGEKNRLRSGFLMSHMQAAYGCR